MIFILETVVERIDVMVGMKCGCLQVLDDGEEYRKIIEKRISNIEEEKKNFLQAVEKGEYARRDWHGWNGEKVLLHQHIYISLLILKFMVIRLRLLILKKLFPVYIKNRKSYIINVSAESVEKYDIILNEH